MQLDKNKFALAGTATAGILYVACAVIVWLWPDFSLQLLGWVAHLVSVDKFAGGVAITLGGVLLGLIEIVVYAYIALWLFAWFYNGLIKPKA